LDTKKTKRVQLRSRSQSPKPRIAIFSPMNFTADQNSTGSIEQLTGLLANGLARRGENVTLFSTGDTSTEAKLVPVIEKAFGKYCDPRHTKAIEKSIQILCDRANQFDIILSELPVSTTARLIERLPKPQPIVAKIIHGSLVKKNQPSLSKERIEQAAKIPFLIPCSQAMIEDESLRYTDVVYHGVPRENLPFIPEPRPKEGSYWAYLGRIDPAKGVHLAVQAAKALNRRLLIAGPISNESEQKYFDTSIKPYLDHNIQYLGVLSAKEKGMFLGQAQLVVAPSNCQEAFGLVTVEALACGTPVLGSNLGAFPEIIQDGKTGGLAHSIDGELQLDHLIQKAPEIEKLDRNHCFESVQNRFTVDAMIEGVQNVIQKMVRHTLEKRIQRVKNKPNTFHQTLDLARLEKQM
jgi:glycosyltransferase involved in cell wall biosynthesis